MSLWFLPSSSGWHLLCFPGSGIGGARPGARLFYLPRHSPVSPPLPLPRQLHWLSLPPGWLRMLRCWRIPPLYWPPLPLSPLLSLHFRLPPLPGLLSPAHCHFCFSGSIIGGCRCFFRISDQLEQHPYSSVLSTADSEIRIPVLPGTDRKRHKELLAGGGSSCSCPSCSPLLPQRLGCRAVPSLCSRTGKRCYDFLSGRFLRIDPCRCLGRDCFIIPGTGTSGALRWSPAHHRSVPAAPPVLYKDIPHDLICHVVSTTSDLGAFFIDAAYSFIVECVHWIPPSPVFSIFVTIGISPVYAHRSWRYP